MTEQEFAVALVTSIFGARGLHVALGRQFKGKVVISSARDQPLSPAELFVLIVDCSSDEQVKTQIREQYSTLVAASYSAIIGLRDVYPRSKQDIPALRNALQVGLPVAPVAPVLHLAVMEVEAWFLAELSHYRNIDPLLTLPFIEANGIDLQLNEPTAWAHPAAVLDSVYKLANKSYMSPTGKKTKRRVQRTLRALSIDALYLNVRHTLPELDDFIGSLEAAFFPE